MLLYDHTVRWILIFFSETKHAKATAAEYADKYGNPFNISHDVESNSSVNHSPTPTRARIPGLYENVIIACDVQTDDLIHLILFVILWLCILL